MDDDGKSLMHDRMEWLQQKAGLRCELELRGLAERIELELERRAAQAEYDKYVGEWKEWWTTRQEERAENLNIRVHVPARRRRERVESNFRNLQAQRMAAAAEYQRASEARDRAWEQEKAEEAACRQIEKEAKEVHIAATIARARNQELERIDAELHRQDCVAQRRAEVMAASQAAERARQEAQHARDEEMEARLRDLRVRVENERREKESIWDANIARVSRMEEKRNAVVQDMARQRMDTAYKADMLRETADRAFATKKLEPLRRLLEAISQDTPRSPVAVRTPRPPSAPSMPQSRSRPSSAGRKRPMSAGTTLRPAQQAALKDTTGRPVPPPLMWLDTGETPSESASTDLPSGCHASMGETVSLSPRRAGSDDASLADATSIHE
mmetsp:Transcript_102944/g.300364  ORF Transcript_102944/g.300364 Transcript_102944/m.300364 type:complete len:386 (-) Transcript_102944:153-1310(-)